MMQTRCTACSTVFRITTEQLKLRQGRVRCGRCHYVFNALEALVVDEAPAQQPVPENGKSAPPRRTVAEQVVAPQPVVTPQPVIAPQPVITPKPVVAQQPVIAPKPVVAPQPVAEPPAVVAEWPAVPPQPIVSPPPSVAPPPLRPSPPPAPSSPPPRISNPAPVPSPVDGDFSLTSIDEVVYATDTPRAMSSIDFELPDILPLEFQHTMAEPEPMLHEPAEPHSWPWVLGSVLALLLLGAQAVYVYRVDITVLRPDLRPVLAAACVELGCDLPLPQQIKLVDIEASDLNPDPANRGRLRLTATLKNRAAFAQQFPSLELTLTDTLDRPLASRVLTPADYLPPKRDAASGFDTREDLAINVPFEVAGTTASGYRLYLFYP
jgi:predicted Zn finger-like uncharacterized protein